MFATRLAALAVCFLLGDVSQAAAQTTLRYLQVGNRTRSYYLRVPPSYTGEEPVPVVLALHGWLGNGRVMENATGFSPKSDREGFILVYPNATNPLPAWNYGWGVSDGDPRIDVDYFNALLDELEDEFNIDPERIFVTGISDGGHAAHFLGSVLSHRITAVAVVGGAVGSYKHGDLVEAPPPKYPVSVAILHGLRDQLTPYDGGPWDGGMWIPVVSVAHSTAFWVVANDCDPEPAKRTMAGGTVVVHTFGGGADKTVVELYVVVDRGHEWFRRPGFDATDVIWEFFANVGRR